MLQAIASGLLGREAFSGGWWTASLGLGLHFLIATSAAALYALASLHPDPGPPAVVVRLRVWPGGLRRHAVRGPAAVRLPAGTAGPAGQHRLGIAQPLAGARLLRRSAHRPERQVGFATATSDMIVRSPASSAVTMRALLVGLAMAMMPLAVGTAAPDSLLYARLESYLEALRVQAGIPGLSAAIVGDTDIVWERGFGRQDLSRGMAALPDTPFHIDGLSQTLTATLVLQCVEQGKLSLDEPVGNHDPASADPGATIRQVLSHTSPGALASRSPTGPSGWSRCVTRYATAPATRIARRWPTCSTGWR